MESHEGHGHASGGEPVDAGGAGCADCYFNLLTVYFALEAGDVAAVRRLLRTTMDTSARQGLRLHPRHDELVSRLCREAIGETNRIGRRGHLDASCGPAPVSVPSGIPNFLSTKERVVLGWVIAGKTNREIGGIQGVSERTVKFHMGNILKKLGAKSRAHAVSIAMERGWVPEG